MKSGLKNVTSKKSDSIAKYWLALSIWLIWSCYGCVDGSIQVKFKGTETVQRSPSHRSVYFIAVQNISWTITNHPLNLKWMYFYTWCLSCMFFHFSGSSKVTKVYRAVQQSRTIQVYVPPFWFCFSSLIPVDRAEISHLNKEQHACVLVTEPALLRGS